MVIRVLAEPDTMSILSTETTMSNHSTALVQKLWNYCNILRDDGLSYGDYVEQLTFLLFLKMAEEQSQPPFNKPSSVPKGYDWPSLMAKDGDELETQLPARARNARQTVGEKRTRPTYRSPPRTPSPASTANTRSCWPIRRSARRAA
jgi:hypothetical protein